MDDDIRIDDRRRVVSAGVEVGREADLEDVRAIANVGPKKTISTVVATRGDDLVLTCVRSSHSGLKDSEVSRRFCAVVEVDTDGKIVARLDSTSMTSTPPSPNSTPATSPAKQLVTRSYGRRSRRATPH